MHSMWLLVRRELTCVCRLLEWLGNARDAAAGAKDVAADLIPLPNQTVLVGLADFRKQLEAHLVLARTIEALSQISGSPFILLLVASSGGGSWKVKRWQCYAERSLSGGCCCCCGIQFAPWLWCSLQGLAISGLFLLGAGSCCVCKLLGWMRLLGGRTHWHKALLAKAPKSGIEEIESIRQSWTGR